MNMSKKRILIYVLLVCFSAVLNAQTTPACKDNHGYPIVLKEEIHNDTCYRIYNVCNFNKWDKKWFTLGEIVYNVVLDSTINYGVFYFLDNAIVDSKNDFFTIMNDKSVQNKTICKFYYNSPDPNFIDDPFKTGKYKHKDEGLPGF